MEDKTASNKVARGVGGERRNKGLCVTLAILVVSIVILTAGIIILKNNSDNDQFIDGVRVDDAIGLSEAMPGWEGEISDSTKAAILTENIQEKLETDADYNPAEAVSEYEQFYSETSGDLKVFIALEYAKYINNTFNDPNRATEIVVVVEDSVESVAAKVDVYYLLKILYGETGDTEKANYYNSLLEERIYDTELERGPGEVNE